MIDVALVDDQQLVRAGFRMVIDSQDDLRVVLEAGDGAQAVRALGGRTHVDVVLMDVRMPTMDGLTATAQITAQPDAPKVVVLTTYADDRSVIDAIRAGARGYLTKDAGGAELSKALREVMDDHAAIDPTVSASATDAPP